MQADFLDVASENQLLLQSAQIAEVRSHLKDYSKLTKCAHPDCDEAPVTGFRFCSRDCRDDYELLIKMHVVKE